MIKQVASCFALLLGCGMHPSGLAQPTGRATVLNPSLNGLHQATPDTLLAWGTDGAIWWHDRTSRRWQQASTPHSGQVRAMARSSSGWVAVGDQGLLLQSTDSGRRWTAQATAAAGNGNNWSDVDCLAGRCLAVGADGAMLRSEDGGQRWDPVPAAPPEARPQGALVGVRAGSPDLWWAGNAEGQLWVSDDSGRRWQRRSTSSGGTPPPSIDALAADGQQLLAASSDGRLLAFSAGTEPPAVLFRPPRGSFTRISALPQPGAWVATGALGACAWRPAASAAWRSCQVSPSRMLRGLASSPDGQQWVVSGENGLLMHSTDQGRTWKALDVAGLNPSSASDKSASTIQRHFEALAWSPAHEGFVAVGSGGLVAGSDAHGHHWRIENIAPEHYVHDMVATGARSLLASSSYRTLSRSDDGGLTWRSRRFDALDDPAFLFALHADPDRGGVVAAGGQGSVMVAPDGQNWRHESLGHGRDYLGLLPHPDQPLVLLYGTGGVALRVNSREGAWQAVKLPSKDPVYGGFNTPGGDQWLLGTSGLLMHSGDEGQTWQAQRVGQHTLRTGMAVADGRVLLVAGDRGTLWRAKLSDPGPDGRQRQAWLQVPTPKANWNWIRTNASGRSLWMGGSHGQMVKSDDLGLSWAPVPLPTQASLREPVYDAQRKHWWMPGRDGVLLHSADDGATWQSVDTHTTEHLKGLWINPQDGSLLLYGARIVHWIPEARP